MSASKPSTHATWARPALLLGIVLGALTILLHNTDLREAAAALPVQLACGRRDSDALLIPRRPAVRLQMAVTQPFHRPCDFSLVLKQLGVICVSGANAVHLS